LKPVVIRLTLRERRMNRPAEGSDWILAALRGDTSEAGVLFS
jgi:hypothetical protein